MSETTSTPTFTQFSPERIPFQDRVISHLDQLIGSDGVHEFLLSGSVGSSKSILMAHAICKHCIQFPGAKALMGRRALPDLRDTLFNKIAEHLDDEYLIDGVHYKTYERECRIEFPFFRSEIIGRSWADSKFSKLRSLELSAAAIEELTENDKDHAYRELKMRVGRLPHIKQNFIISATNPDSPSHWVYKYFIEPNIHSKHATRHVYYSLTHENPFLPTWYIEQLKKDFDPKMARRMLYGEWIEISQEVVYHSYQADRSFRPYKYKIDPSKPIIMAFDFNIGKGKPMSVVFGQEVADEYHWFKVVAIHGSRTEQIMEECLGLGLLEHDNIYEVYGDATGEHKDTRSLFTDYDIIKKFLSNVRRKNGQPIAWVLNVPRSNPPVRTRHNIVNGYCMNAKGQTRFYVYEGAELLDKGMRLTALKDNGSYIEDDSPEYQHCTTAIGYAIVYKYNLKGLTKIGAF
jgi:PBSX family phage terminase large subunit